MRPGSPHRRNGTNRAAHSVLRTGFSDKDGPVVTLVDFRQHFAKGAVECVPPAERCKSADPPEAVQVIKPLVVPIEIDAEDVQVFRVTTQFRRRRDR